MMGFSELLVRELRANPAYDLVLFDRLSPEERRALADLAADPGFYGVLRRRGGAGPAAGLVPRSVDRDTALLFLTLREPGPLPSYVRGALGAACERTIARLVADGVLEVRNGSSFVSGAAAGGLLGPAGEEVAEGRLARLSLAALRHAQALPGHDPARLAWSLYAYNRRPLTPRWRRLLPSAEAVEAHLGIAPGGSLRARLDRSWSRGSSTGWLSWLARRRARLEASADGTTYKLYLSPQPEALAEGFAAILDAITAARAAQFKVGSDAWGLLRPDKIVAYFPRFENLAEAAETVRRRLEGTPAQGVPFTSEIGGEGLLSWGIDPPRSRGAAGEGPSWRFWLARRLAQALLAARRGEGETPEAYPFALERLRLEGVDTSTWTPGALLWRES